MQLASFDSQWYSKNLREERLTQQSVFRGFPYIASPRGGGWCEPRTFCA